MNGLLDGVLAVASALLLMVWTLFVELVLPLLGILLVLLLIAVIRTLVQGHKTSTYVPTPDPAKETLCAEKLSAMVQCETISVRGVEEPEKFRRFHQGLKELSPTVFSHCEAIDIDGNLLLRWKGISSSDPIMLMSHMDVVPAGGGWSRDPFSGEIADR